MKKRVAFKMFLKPGFDKEYERRHNEIWPELVEIIKKSGISNYSIYYDKESNFLFACQEVDIEYNYSLENDPIMRKWWSYMSDIMITNDDLSPVVIELKEVFHMN